MLKTARAQVKLFALFLLAILFTAQTMASDWSQFRGPNGAGVSDTRGLPAEFGPQKNVIWKTPSPQGHSSPVLSQTKIFLTGFEEKKLFTLCLDRKTGRLLWQREVPRPRSDRLQKPNNPASPSPVTDGQNVYVFFQDFGLISYDSAGKERWRVPLGPFNTFFGMGASPILVDDTLVMPCDQDTNSFMVAVDKNTGRVRWKIDRPGVISGYSTPIVYRPKDGPAQVIVAESFQLSSYSVATGERVWWVRGLACEMKSIPVVGGDVLYVNGWGLPENQPGKQIAIPPFEETIAKFDKDGDSRLSKAEPADERVKQDAYFQLVDMNRDGYINQSEWNVYRAIMAAENGLLAIKMGGKGDMTDKSILWKYQKPVPQVPSTLLYKGVLYMVNDGGVLISFNPASGAVFKQGRLEGAIDKYFASPVAADDKVFLVGEGGAVSVLKADAQWEVLKVNTLDDEVYATPAIADGRIYIRTRSAIYCFGNSK
ncbi:MAG TPA: PQQ-binding-like beta-propeller repeat protein [Blastocatellia bacterium]